VWIGNRIGIGFTWWWSGWECNLGLGFELVVDEGEEEGEEDEVYWCCNCLPVVDVVRWWVSMRAGDGGLLGSLHFG